MGLSIGAVYSASDLCNQQLASSLGLQWEQPASQHPEIERQSQNQPPNFLLSSSSENRASPTAMPLPILPSPKTRPRILQASQHSRQQPQPQSQASCLSLLHKAQSGTKSSSQASATPHSFQRINFHNASAFAPLAPPSLTSRHKTPPPKANSPHILPPNVREITGPRPAPVELPPVPPPLIKRTPTKPPPPPSDRDSSRSIKVVNAADDDVVEVICIDD